MELKNNKRIVNFCNKYDVDINVLRNYLDSLKMGDLLNADVYHVLICENCPKKQLDDLKNDLNNLVKGYFEKI